MSEQFYTYLWLRTDGTPYYVGKGKSNRAYRKGCPSNDRILIQPYPSEQDAFAAEIFLIGYYGRKDIGTGILRNLTDGGEGNSNPSEEVRRKMRATQQAIAQTLEGQQHLKQMTAAAAEANKDRIPSDYARLIHRETFKKIGRRMAESGHCQRIAHLGGGDAAHMAHMRTFRTPESIAKGGRIGGKIVGKKNVESGHLAKLRTPEHQRAASRASTHRRWHVKRGIVNIGCTLCQQGVISCQQVQ